MVALDETRTITNSADILVEKRTVGLLTGYKAAIHLCPTLHMGLGFCPTLSVGAVFFC